MKNSPESKSQPSPIPSSTGSVTTELQQLRLQKDALSQLLWEVVRKASPETETIEVSSAVSDPLWLLAFVPGSKEGTTKILAGTMPPITEQEKKRVVRLLRGTNTPMGAALLELKLPYPPSYVEKQIAAHLVWKKSGNDDGGAGSAGTWESVRGPELGEQLKNVLRIPKS